MKQGDIPSLVERLRSMAPRPDDGGEERHNRQLYADAADALDALSPRKDAVGGGVPAGMVAWGPDSPGYPNAPRDWDGGATQRRTGKVYDAAQTQDHVNAIGERAWQHSGDRGDIIAYTPKAASSYDGDAAADVRRGGGDSEYGDWNGRTFPREGDEARERIARKGVYVASRASIPARGEMWRALRASGIKVNSTWIDEDGEGETADWGELWTRIEAEVKRSAALILYAEPSDFPLKGAFVEAGIAIAVGVPVFVVAPGVALGSYGCRPIGSWASHPLVTYADSIEQALAKADAILAARPTSDASERLREALEPFAKRAEAFAVVADLPDKTKVEIGGKVPRRDEWFDATPLTLGDFRRARQALPASLGQDDEQR